MRDPARLRSDPCSGTCWRVESPFTTSGLDLSRTNEVAKCLGTAEEEAGIHIAVRCGTLKLAPGLE